MKKIYYLFKVSLEKTIKELSRYKFNTFSDIILLYVLFMAMFLGLERFGIYMGVSPVKMGDSLEGFIAGYFLWTIMISAYSNIAYNVVNDSSRGTLEQLNMSGISLHCILTVRSLVNLLIDFIIYMILLLMIMNTTGYWLSIKIFSILIPIFIGIFSILGIGLIFGGLALIFKKVQSLLNVVQYFLIALLVVNPQSEIISNILPFRPCIDMVYAVMRADCSFTEFSFINYVISIGNSIFYFVIGILIFNQCVKIAKNKGLLGQY